MSDPESVVCPSCENEVAPIVKRLPGDPDKNGRVGSPIVLFGKVCPVCAGRLDATIERMRRGAPAGEAMTQQEEPSAVAPIAKPVQVRQTKPNDDLFDRIRSEYEDACREERELRARLDFVTTKREKLERGIAAMDLNPIAAE